MVGLAHFFDNAFAGSAHGVAKGGLTGAGRELVAELERRRIARRRGPRLGGDDR